MCVFIYIYTNIYIYTYIYIYIYIYIDRYIKINEKQKASFSLLLRTRFTAVAALQALQTLLCLKTRNSGETRSAKAKKRKPFVFL